MFFIFPIGSEEGVRRLPYITIGLIAINTIIWLVTNAVAIGQSRKIEEINGALFQIETRYFYEVQQQDPNILMVEDYDQLHEAFQANEFIPVDSEDHAQWQYLYEQYKRLKAQSVFNQLGFTPKEFNFLKIFSAMFVHANFFHLLFNMLFLWLAGCNIEDDWSWKVFLGLYIISGIVATLFHAMAHPQSSMPLIGASGAIAGIMGAFMIRHYKTKIRFAYFIWIIFRPFIGTFAVYAGIALPFWFLQQILGASWSVGEAGTAYWAHIGGFIFGGIIGASLRVFGIEKKYIEPMVEDSFEKLKLSAKMKEVYQKLDAGDNTGAMPLLLALLKEEPENHDVPLMLARIYFEKGHYDDAQVMYNKAFEIILVRQNRELLLSMREELKEKKILDKLSEKNLYNFGQFLESIADYQEATKMYGLYISCFPKGSVRHKAIYRTYLVFRDKLNEPTMAQAALAFLEKEYPNWPKP